MYDAVEYGVCDRLFADYVVPALHRHLRCEHRLMLLIAILDNIHQYAARLRVKRLHVEVIED